MKKVIILSVFFFVSKIYSQETFAYDRHTFNKHLIEKNILNKITKKQFEKNYEYEATYLGKFYTKKGKQFYLVNSSYINLKSLHNDNEIFIYDSKKKFVGYYNLTTNYQLPFCLKENKLFFTIEDCDKKIIGINLVDGIPKLINLKCDENNSDTIEFVVE